MTIHSIRGRVRKLLYSLFTALRLHGIGLTKDQTLRHCCDNAPANCTPRVLTRAIGGCVFLLKGLESCRGSISAKCHSARRIPSVVSRLANYTRRRFDMLSVTIFSVDCCQTARVRRSLHRAGRGNHAKQTQIHAARFLHCYSSHSDHLYLPPASGPCPGSRRS